MTLLHGPAAAIHKGGTAAIASADRLPDPIERYLALKNADAVVVDVQRTLRQARAAALRDAVAERTITSVSAELGLSRQRIHQLLAES